MIEANLEGVTATNVTATKAKFQKANLKNAGKYEVKLKVRK